MKKTKQIYGKPTSEDLAVMNIELEYLVDFDLSQHMNVKYPVQGSYEEEQDLKRVIDASRSPKLSPAYLDIADRLIQAPFQAQAKSLKISYPEDLISKLLRESQYYIMILKYHYNRPRPGQVAERLGVKFDKNLTPSAHTPSFPSGHTAQANLIATVMSRMYPRHKGHFDLVADSIERSRLELGVHFPTDNEAGRALGKHLGNIAPLKKQTGLIESSGIDPHEVDEKEKVGLTITIPEDITVTDTLDAIKAIEGITTVRQVGSQREQPNIGRSVFNAFVTIVAGVLSPEGLHRRILSLDDIVSVHIRNIDGVRYSQSRPRRKIMRRTANESLVQEFVREIISEAVEMDDELYADITDAPGGSLSPETKEKMQKSMQSRRTASGIKGKPMKPGQELSKKFQYRKLAQLTKAHYEQELSDVLGFFPQSLSGNPVNRPGDTASIVSMIDAEIENQGLNKKALKKDFVGWLMKTLKQKSPSASPEAAFHVALKTSPQSTAGNKLEDAIAAYCNTISPGIAGAAAAQAAGEDLVIGSVTCEVKSAEDFDFTSQLNASSFVPDPNKAYLYIVKSTSASPRIFVISSDLLHKAYTYSGTKQATSDGTTLDKVVDDGLDRVLGDISLKDFVTNVVVSGKPQDMVKSFDIPGTSLSVRLKINFTANKLGRIEDSFDVRVLNTGILLSEELTKSDKKEIERIAKKTVKKEIEAAIRDFKKSELEKEITKILGGKASKEELSKITKNVIKRLYRELSVNYPTIIDRIKV